LDNNSSKPSKAESERAASTSISTGRPCDSAHFKLAIVSGVDLENEVDKDIGMDKPAR
jgi:hypothetical protein